MYKQWVEASQLARHDAAGDAWAVDYSGHPLLDPTFAQRPTRIGRFFRMMYNRIRHDDKAYTHEVARMLGPAGDPGEHGPEDLVPYLTEADAYVRDLIALLPEAARQHAAPQPVIAACNDFRTLLSLLFSRDDDRIRFEAQRKLYLAKLLLDIEQSRPVQDGPAHKHHFETLLRKGMWEFAKDTNTGEIGFELNTDDQTIEYNLDPRPGQQRWEFNSIFVCREVDDRKIPLDVLYYNCRFKRTVTPISYEVVDGSHHVIERKRWDTMRGNSNGSIVSKMVRKGINDPAGISDMLGAIFVVHDEDAMDELIVMLDHVVGNPIGWRNVTDTSTDKASGSTLNPHSGRGYRVFKGDLDVLYPAPDQRPYRYHVEVQIYTLEGFLRTVHGAHDANHLALKLRQFLHGIVPAIFPRAIYGDDWVSLGNLQAAPLSDDATTRERGELPA